MNSVNLCGRLTRDPELKSLSSGKSVVSFSLAVNESKDKVVYVDCEAWDRTADSIVEFFEKGKPISVSGRLKSDKWQTEDGSTRSKLAVVVERFFFVPGSNGKPSEDAASEPVVKKGRKPKSVKAPEVPVEDFNSDDVADDDIPF